MKQILLIFSFLFIGYQAQSQVLISIIFGDKLNSPNLEFGLEGGYNWSNISGFQTGTPLSTFNLGFYFDFRIKNNFYIYTGVLVKSNLGISSLTNDDINLLGSQIFYDSNGVGLEGTYSQRLNYFLVPILAKYRWKNNIYVEGGIQAGLMYKSWVQFDSNIEDKDAILKDYNKEDINKIDVGALVGAGFKFNKGPGWSVGIKYYYGFIDVYKSISNTKNSALFIKVNVPIGANKKKKTENK